MEHMIWDPRDPFRIVGISSVAERLRTTTRKYSRGLAPIIITGETGVGKELVAWNIHQWGDRAGGPFVAVDCGSLTESLLEAELFGHDANAFTGAASKGKKGRIEEANEGILFLDEIGNLKYQGQVALLRVLEDRKVVRVGASYGKEVNFRLIAGTSTDIDSKLKEGSIRSDFYYRIRGVSIDVPPLRERREDIPPLANYFMSKYERTGMGRKEIDPAAMLLLTDYDWPGNIRQLDKVIETAMYTENETIDLETIEETLLGYPLPSPEASQKQALLERCFEAEINFEEYKGAIVRIALQKAGGNQTDAAKMLGMTYHGWRHYYKKYIENRTPNAHNSKWERKSASPSNSSNGNGNEDIPEQAQPTAEPSN